MKKKLLAFFAVLFSSIAVFLQTATLSAQPVTTCENSNFSLGTFKNWQGCYGYFGNKQIPGFPPPPDHVPCEVQGFLVAPQPPLYDKPLHKMIPAPGWNDPNTCDSLQIVFPGEDYVVRIGDTSYTTGTWNTGKEAEMKYAVTVSNDSYLFIYRYAVVLQTGGHGANMQPDFQVMITDEDGIVLDSTCGYYYVTAQESGPPVNGWHSCNWTIGSGAVYWKDWTTVGLDMTPYLGQTVYVTFKVRGCYYETHFGYAMLSAYCGFLQIQTALCEGDTVATLTAPPGFTYLWNTGDTTQSISVPNPVTGAQYLCTLTAVNGCQVSITVNLTYTEIHSNFTHGPACAGNPVQFTDSSWVNQNWVTNWIWNYGDGTPQDTGIAAPLHTFALPGTYDVKLVSFSTEGCYDSIVKQIIVDSVPHVTNQPLGDTICSNDSTYLLLTADLPGTLFTWTAASDPPGITGYSDNTIPTTLLNQTLVNTGNMPDTVFYTIFPHAGDCDGPDTIYWVIVQPMPVLTNSPLVKSICDSTSTALTLSANLDSTLFTWTCTASSLNLTGYSDNTTSPDSVINQVINNTGFTTDTVYYHLVGQSNGCTGDTVIFKVAVHPTPDLSNNPPADTICNNTTANITLTSNVAGTLFTWTCTPSSPLITGWSNNPIPTTLIDHQLINSSNIVQTVTYHVVPTADGCDGPVTDYTVTVYPTPTMTNSPASQAQCNTMNTNITLTGNLPGMLFTWTCTPSSPSITGWSNNAIPSLSINHQLISSSTIPETVTYHVAPTVNGCNGPAMDYTVTVYPTPNLSNNPASQSQCNNVNTNIILTSNVAGTLFTWTCTPSSPSITGWSNNAIPSLSINHQLISSSTIPETVTYHVAPTANGCNGPVMDYTVTVYPTPTVTNSPASQTQCNNTNTNIVLTSNVPGTLFTWTCTPSSPSITGWSNNAIPSLSINHQLISSSTIPETVTYHVAPTVNGCLGPTTNYVVTVYPTPNLSNNPASQSQCNNVNTNIVLTSNVPGTLFTWTCTPSSPSITGWSNNAIPSISINHQLISSSTIPETVTYQVTPTANGCPGPPMPYTVTVFPVANVVFTPNGQSICSGLTTAISLSSSVAGATFTWTASGSGPSLTGYGPGSGNLIQQTLTNTGPYPEGATYQVAPTANGCPGANSSVIVTVNPFPAVTVTPCFDPVTTTNAQSFTLRTGLPLGGTWSGPGVSAGMFNPATAGPGVHPVNYAYTNTWGCAGNAGTTITVITPAGFLCGGTVTDIRDNQSYSTIQIGTQCWFSVNLNYGTTIPSTQMQLDNCIREKYCFNDNPGNCLILGGMYQWDEMMNYTQVPGNQGFCPPGWHVPTEGDWNTLFSFYISNGFAGSPLKSTGYSGFNALMIGTRFNNVQWDFSGFAVMIWSSAPHGPRKAWAHGMNIYNPSVSYYPSHRNNAFWVRCILD